MNTQLVERMPMLRGFEMPSNDDSKILHLEIARWQGSIEAKVTATGQTIEAIKSDAESVRTQVNSIAQSVTRHEAVCEVNWKNQNASNISTKASLDAIEDEAKQGIIALTARIDEHEKKLIKIALLAALAQTVVVSILIPILVSFFVAKYIEPMKEPVKKEGKEK